MNVIQTRVKILIKQDISLSDIQSRVCGIIDFGFSKEKELLDLHNQNQYKFYCFDYPYPLEQDRIYKKGKIYTLTIRTMNINLADFFSNSLLDIENKYIKVINSEMKIIQKKRIEKIYSLTPIIMKVEEGYWKNHISPEEFERRLKENLIKKYNELNKDKIDEDFELFNSIEYKNIKPIAVKYKNIKLLGDKVSLMIADNIQAQQLAFMSIGCGIMEMNSRGCGFVNFKFAK